MTPEKLKSLQGAFTFETAFNAMSDFLSVHDREFRVVQVNPALCGFFGKTAEQIIGHPCHVLFHGEDRPWSGCPLVKAMIAGAPVTETVETRFPEAALQVTCSPIFDGHGIVTGGVHLARQHVHQEEGFKGNGDSPTRDLEKAFVKSPGRLGVIPICTSCKRVRDEKGLWHQIEAFFRRHSALNFTHGICPECAKRLYPDLDLVGRSG